MRDPLITDGFPKFLYQIDFSLKSISNDLIYAPNVNVAAAREPLSEASFLVGLSGRPSYKTNTTQLEEEEAVGSESWRKEEAPVLPHCELSLGVSVFGRQH